MSRELLFSVTKKDLIIQTMTAGGKGGQHQNRVETAVRITHKASGAVGEARDSKSQHANKKAAFERMAYSPKFKAWQRMTAAEIMSGKTVEQRVDEAMDPRNLKVEVRAERGWEELPSSTQQVNLDTHHPKE